MQRHGRPQRVEHQDDQGEEEADGAGDEDASDALVGVAEGEQDDGEPGRRGQAETGRRGQAETGRRGRQEVAAEERFLGHSGGHGDGGPHRQLPTGARRQLLHGWNPPTDAPRAAAARQDHHGADRADQRDGDQPERDPRPPAAGRRQAQGVPAELLGVPHDQPDARDQPPDREVGDPETAPRAGRIARMTLSERGAAGRREGRDEGQRRGEVEEFRVGHAGGPPSVAPVRLPSGQRSGPGSGPLR